MCSAQSVMCTVQSALCLVLCAVCSVQCGAAEVELLSNDPRLFSGYFWQIQANPALYCTLHSAWALEVY